MNNNKCNYCDICKRSQWVTLGNSDSDGVELQCIIGHKPRFYMPKHDNPYDTNWGYKRVCRDFLIKEPK